MNASTPSWEWPRDATGEILVGGQPLTRVVDAIGSTFRMTAQHQQVLNDGGEVVLADAGATARISLLPRFPLAEPHQCRA